jgi:hypothetical protein
VKNNAPLKWRSYGRTQIFKTNALPAQASYVLAAILFIAYSPLTLAQSGAAAIEPSIPYVIQPKDKLLLLGPRLLNTGDWVELARFNGLKPPYALIPGKTLNIPLRLIGSAPSTAKVISASGDVQVQGLAAATGTMVAEGGKFQTGANSSAVLELADGSRVTVLPNTLAELVTSRGYATRDAAVSASSTWFSGLIRLVQGGLDTAATKGARRATPLQIQTPTSLVGVRGTQFRVAFDDPANNSARTEVVEGKVRADNTAQQSGADLPKGTGAVVKPLEKDVKVVKLLPAPDLAGIPAVVIRQQGGWPMPVLSGSSGYRVQVASDEKFEQIVRDLKVTTATADLATLANGNWFARVRGIDGQGLEGFDAFKTLTVKDIQWRVSYSALSFENGQSVLNWTGLLDGRVMTGSAGVTGYSATVARDRALTQVVSTAEAAGERLVLGELKPGAYFIQLRNRTAAGGTLDSELYRFDVPNGWGESSFRLNGVLEPVR